jgi:hypothetical protein
MRSYDGETNAPPPQIAPGAGGGSPIVEPDRGAPALTPGLPGSRITEPEQSLPLVAPGSATSEPLELSRIWRPPLVDPLHGLGLDRVQPATRYSTEYELRWALNTALRYTTSGPSDGRSLIDDVRAVIRSGRLPSTPANDTLVKMLEDVYRINRDPALVADGAVELWLDAGWEGKTVRAALEDFFANQITDVRGDLTLAILRANPTFRDLEFAADYHGAHTHMFSEHLVDLEMGDGAGRRFRQAIADATGPDVADTPNGGTPKPFAWAVWDAVYDVEYGDHINRPEVLGRILQEHLGLPRWLAPP